MNHIYIIEDDSVLCSELALALEAVGYHTTCANDFNNVLNEFLLVSPDLVILDINLPNTDGFILCMKIRKVSQVPIIFITGRDSQIDELQALSLGGDDYITKPFNPLEVVARVKTQLRRYVRYNNAANTKEKDTPIAEHDVRGLIINKNTHKCTLYGKEVTLTPIEFSILWYLCENRGKVIPSEELFENVWGEQYLDNNNTVMAHIGRLREKLNEPAKKPKFIKTVWGVGYTIEK